jgi:hypothetical protein
MQRTLKLAGLGLALAAASGCDLFDFGIDDYEDDGYWSGGDDGSSFPGDDDFGGDGDFSGGPAPQRLYPTVRAAKRPPALSGGTLTVSPDGNWAVAADPDRDQVYFISMQTKTVSTVRFDEGAEPGRVAFDLAGHAHVVLRGANAVASIELSDKDIAHQTPVCQLPRGIAYHPGQGTMMIACANGELVGLDALTHAEVSRDLLDRDLRDVVVDAQGDLLVSLFRSAELLRVREGSIVSRSRPPSISRERFETERFTDDGEIIELPPTIQKSPTQAWRMVASGDGEVVVVHERGDDSEVVPAPGGYGGSCESITESVVTRFDAQGVARKAPTLSGIAAGVDVALSPDGKFMAVANPPAYLNNFSGTVQVFRSATVEDGSPDDGCGTSSEGQGGTLGQATSVAFDGEGHLLVQSREPAQLEIYDLIDDEQYDYLVETRLRWLIPLSDVSMRDTGYDLFHADVGQNMTCMGCHGEAHDDGHTWTFRGFGPRRTQALGGGILATAPFHWEGDMLTFRHLVNEVMVGRMGGFDVEDDQIEALAEWLDKQPALQLVARDPNAVKRGKLLFESAETACASCHTGPALTNNTTVDVGTGGLFQVPSLRGLAMRAPFMHDGCAKTLRGRFDSACGGAAHGNISGLSEAEIDDMVAYLESL